MEGGFFVTDSALPRSANCGDVFSRVSWLLLKEIVDLRATLEFYELNCLQPKSAEPLFCSPCNSPTCPPIQMHLDFMCDSKEPAPGLLALG